MYSYNDLNCSTTVAYTQLYPVACSADYEGSAYYTVLGCGSDPYNYGESGPMMVQSYVFVIVCPYCIFNILIGITIKPLALHNFLKLMHILMENAALQNLPLSTRGR